MHKLTLVKNFGDFLIMHNEGESDYYEDAKKSGYAHLICVPASLQFILSRGHTIPTSIYEDAKNEGGLFPSQVLETLKQKKILTFAAYSVGKDEMETSFSNQIRVMLLNNEILGVGLSIQLNDDHFHFITFRGPVINNDVQVFDTSSNPESYRDDIDRVLSRAISASEFGRNNVYFIYPAAEANIIKKALTGS